MNELNTQILDFIRTELLAGQGEGLDESTKLLELGILDSFGLFKLIAFLRDRFGVTVKPEEIIARDFKDVSAIGAMVTRSRPEAVASSPAGAADPEGILTMEAPACAQLFIAFTGIGRDLTMDSATFFSEAGLEGRNAILIRDMAGLAYTRGISAAMPTPDSVCAWLGQWIQARKHIREVYCLGPSSGGPMAMIAGQYLRARKVWAFAPRPARASAFEEATSILDGLLRQTVGKSLTALSKGELSPEEIARIRAAVTPDLVQRYERYFTDPGLVLDHTFLEEVRRRLLVSDGAIRHAVYYVERNTIDRHVAQIFGACPGVELHALEPSPDEPYPWPLSPLLQLPAWLDRDHLVVRLMRNRGLLGTLFPAYVPA